ncbi:MAG: glycosyltransferase family 39 protein [Planctomycetota bacterium]|nr:glycosyltransferase family 39 protein [Planctomycetota bacterium]
MLKRWRVIPRRKKCIYSLAGVLLVAFLLPLFTGSRGFFPYDQSIIFDGGYRVLIGQVPFRDFYLPYPPLAIWIQALSFYLFGVNYWAYVIPAAMMNLLGTACAFYMLRLLLPREEMPALVAAGLTAIWLYPIFGTTYPEQTAFVLTFAGMTALLAGITKSQSFPKEMLLTILTGVCCGLSILCKQNAGLLTVPLYLIIALFGTPNIRKFAQVVGFIALGCGLILAAFLGWLAWASSIESFFEYTMTIAGSEGRRRLFSVSLKYMVRTLVAGKGKDIVCIVAVSMGVFALFVFVLTFLRVKHHTHDETWARLSLAAALACAVHAFQNLFSFVSGNDGINEKPFLGLLAGICLGLYQYSDSASYDDEHDRLSIRFVKGLFIFAAICSILGKSGTPILGAILGVGCAAGVGVLHSGDHPFLQYCQKFLTHRVIGRCLVIFIVVLTIIGLMAAVRRDAHEPFDQGELQMARFPEPFPDRRLAGLKWGQPTLIDGVDVKQEYVVDLISHLRARGGNFFIYPTFSALYAVVNTTPPQPLLWMWKLFFSFDSEKVDKEILASLKENKIRTFVLETNPTSLKGWEQCLCAFRKEGDILPCGFCDFPLTQDYLKSSFKRGPSFGIFRVHHLKEEGAAK